MRIRRVITAATLAGAAGVGTLALTPAASAAEPPRPVDHKVVIDHRPVLHRDILAICRQEHRPHHRFLVRVDSLRDLRRLEHRFDLDCRVLRFVPHVAPR